MADWRILEGDCVEVLRQLDAGSIQTCVTSPPYWGLRDYGTASWTGGDDDCDHAGAKQKTRYDYALDSSPIQDGSRTGTDAQAGSWAASCPDCGAVRADAQLGLEPTPEDYVDKLVAVFREVRRVLRDDGTVWLNLGDSYATSAQAVGEWKGAGPSGNMGLHGAVAGSNARKGRGVPAGLKPKDLVGIPWRVAFALQADGWWLRSDIIWAKPNPMPESVTDRPTLAHEYIFLLTKSARYFYDAVAIREKLFKLDASLNDRERMNDAGGANKRSVWNVATQPYPGAHFATFPPKLIEPCILAGSSAKVCPSCQKPYQRVLERTDERSYKERRHPGKKWSESAEHGRLDWGGAFEGLSDAVDKGQVPDCDCEVESPTQSLVLDPFAGAGTAAVVSVRQGRDFVGIELNAEYAQLARDRINAWLANPNGYLKSGVEVPEGQMSIEDAI